MATRADYRAALSNKLLALEDGGYGDFEYAVAELDTFLDLSCLRMFPAVHRRVDETVTTVPSPGDPEIGIATPTTAELSRVYMIADTTNYEQLTGWRVRGSTVVGLPLDTQVTLYWTEPYTIPPTPTTDAGIPDIYTPLIVLGGLIEALEARQDTGVRGEPPPTGPYFTTQLLATLIPRYDKMLEQLAMGLPAVKVM